MENQLFEVARHRLDHIFWIGGPGCSGKTSAARLLGRQFDLSVYHVDDQVQNQKPEPQLRSARWRNYEFAQVFSLPANDAAACVTDEWQTAIFVQSIKHLMTWPRGKCIIVEGTFLPETLLNVATPDRIAVMVSGNKFRRDHFAHRQEWYAAYEDKAAVFKMTIEALDIMDREWTHQAVQCQVPIFRIASPQSIDDVVSHLADQISRCTGLTQTLRVEL